MRECRSSGCWQFTDDTYCYFHEKKQEGLFDAPPAKPVDPLSAEGLALLGAVREFDKPHDPKTCRSCRRKKRAIKRNS